MACLNGADRGIVWDVVSVRYGEVWWRHCSVLQRRACTIRSKLQQIKHGVVPMRLCDYKGHRKGSPQNPFWDTHSGISVMAGSGCGRLKSIP